MYKHRNKKCYIYYENCTQGTFKNITKEIVQRKNNKHMAQQVKI